MTTARFALLGWFALVVFVFFWGSASGQFAKSAGDDWQMQSVAGPSLGLPGAKAEGPVAVSAEFTLPTADRPSELFIKADIQEGWHIYSLTQKPGGPIKTTIALDPSDAFRVTGPFEPSVAPEKKNEEVFDNLSVETHTGTVVWRAPIQFASGVDPAKAPIRGKVTIMACETGSCTAPTPYAFTAKQGEGIVQEPVPQSKSLWTELLFAFLGGLLLNFMPCVLPVISLKVLTFLHQAGESRSRVFFLNLWYVAGTLVVFMLLASLAAWGNMAWGEQFTLPWFKIAMALVVFAMALSFLGVWELPIPGFVGHGRADKLQTQEGPSGAFFKGVFATILATPCSGPFLGPVFAWLLTQPPSAAYLIFGAVGLGMSSPYLVIGAFPTLIRFLPRPGVWMETFQHLMGFLLLATVVYLFSTLSAAYFLPTLTTLVGVWFACWMIGRIPLISNPVSHWVAWVSAIGIAVLIGFGAFIFLLQASKIEWQKFSPEAVAAARAQGKTVMVDFSADWCWTCKWNLKFAIETDAVQQLLQKNGVVPMLADWTDPSPVIKESINGLGYQSIPLLVVYPPEGEPIVLTDVLTQGRVIEALEKAGPSSKNEPVPEKSPSVPAPSAFRPSAGVLTPAARP